MGQVFADTWAWLALFNKRDSHHHSAVAGWRELIRRGRRILTSEFVWIETFNAMAAAPLRAAAMQGRSVLLRSAHVETVPFDLGHLSRAFELYHQRHDKEWSLTDCTSFVIMDELKLKEAFTRDRHFEQAGFRAIV